MLLRHRRDHVWVFHPELTGIFAASRGFPFRVTPGKFGPVAVYRIERHVFKTGVAPVERNIAYRVIVSVNAALRSGANTDSQSGNGGRNHGNGDRSQPGSRRGYRGRSSQPLHEMLDEARELVRRARPMFDGAGPVEDHDAADHADDRDNSDLGESASAPAEGPGDLEMDLLAGQEDLNDVDMLDANPDPELDQLLAAAQNQQQVSCPF